MNILKRFLNEGDLNFCDGFCLSLFSGAPRVTGVDFMLDFAPYQNRGEVFITRFGSKDAVVKKKPRMN